MTLAFVVVSVLIIAGGFAYGARQNMPRLRQEKPLRDEIRGRPQTFRAEIELKDISGPVSLSVHGDVFEVAQKVPVLMLVNGTDYCYRAQDVTLETTRGFRHDWIIIQGQPGTGTKTIRIGHRKVNRLLWDVLASAGAHPIGPPPER